MPTAAYCGLPLRVLSRSTAAIALVERIVRLPFRDHSRRALLARALDPQIRRVALARIEAIACLAVVEAHFDHVRVAEFEHHALRDRRLLVGRVVLVGFLRDALHDA